MFFRPEKIDEDLLILLIGGMYPERALRAHIVWLDLMREARPGWVFSNPAHEPLMFPQERGVALRRFLDLCGTAATRTAPERIRAACMEVWGVPFYAGRGSLTLCEPLALEGALADAGSVGYLTVTSSEPRT